MKLFVIDLGTYLEISSMLGSESNSSNLDPVLRGLREEVSQTLRETGALVVKNHRCSARDNELLIDMMVKYFEKPNEFKRLQKCPQLHYQFQIMLLRLAGFLFPCYVMARSAYIMQCRRRRFKKL